MNDAPKLPETPEEVLVEVRELLKQHRKRGIHLKRLKMWAEVGLQGLTPDQVRAFSTKESHIEESYRKWLKERRPDASAMSRATFALGGPPGKDAPEWVREVVKSRDGRYEGNLYTVAILKTDDVVRLDPPVVIPPDEE